MTNNPRVAFHICAHPDDWILFGGAWAFWNLRVQTTIVVMTTAGDAQCQDAWWQVREHAAVAALQSGLDGAAVEESRQPIQGENPHNIQVYRSGGKQKRTALYCLRLFNRSQPIREPGLWELYYQMGPAGTVDGSTVYTSWNDFCLTLKNIVLFESRDSSAPPYINAHLYRSDPAVNPGDHCEHTLTGEAVRSFAQAYPRSWWWGYEIMRHHEQEGWQITNSELLTGKRRLWDAYRQTIQRDVAAGAQLSPDSLRWADAALLDSEWETWGTVSYAEEREPGEEDR